jgi:hypothetical protein
MQKNKKKFCLFKRKSKEEKAAEQIRKKIAQIEKLKNEVITMGRLVLKDGKLEKAESVQQQAPAAPVQERVMPAPPIDVEYTPPSQQQQMAEEDDFIEEPAMFRGRPQQQEIQEPPMYRRPEPQEPPMYRPPQRQQQRIPQDLTVEIILIEGQTVQVKVSPDNAQGLLDDIGNSIVTGAILVVGSRGINPRHIVMYQYG